MPKTQVVLFRADDGSCPFVDWFDGLPEKAQDKCFARLERLRELGHELRRPDADLLRDGIYELRCSVRRVQYRILYFFHGSVAAVIAYGIVKEGSVPAAEIDRAVSRKRQFELDPRRHTYEEV